MLRKAIDIDHYGINEMNPAIYRLHIEHCLDILREAIMCVVSTLLNYFQFFEAKGSSNSP